MIHYSRLYCIAFLIITLQLTGFLIASPSLALEPDQVLVLANRNAERSIGLTEYYMKTGRGASLDSEISLIKAEDYPINGWIQNPFFLGFCDKKFQIGKGDVLMENCSRGRAPVPSF